MRIENKLTFTGALAILALDGLVDATLGWKISNWLGADPQGVYKNLTLRGGTLLNKGSSSQNVAAMPPLKKGPVANSAYIPRCDQKK
jgi:hypothetical protein